jgi:hypothetical protein
MKHPDEEIEALLARLAPAPPDPALMARLQAAKPGPRRSQGKTIYLWAPLAAAAGVAFALIPRNQTPVRTDLPGFVDKGDSAPGAPELQPVSSLQHLMDVADLGIVRDENNMPVRLIRTRWIDEFVYENPQGGEPVKEGRLREEVMPVSLPFY